MDSTRPNLESLGGAAAPPGLAADLRRLFDLPESAQKRLWDALGPALAEPLPVEVEATLTAFCETHGARDDELSRALKACRFLLRSAAAAGLEAARFTRDLAALAGPDDSARLAAMLLPGYDAARRFVRRDLARRTVEAHGKVVESTEWRVERVVASNHGDDLDLPLAAVTFRYREGDRTDQITLYLDPEALAELARAHARIRR